MLLGRMKTLREEARELKEEKLPFVLCHTDIHGGNLIRGTPQGKLWLIDWENVMLAPKEADLFPSAKRSMRTCFVKMRRKGASLLSAAPGSGGYSEFLTALLTENMTGQGREEVLSHVKWISDI